MLFYNFFFIYLFFWNVDKKYKNKIKIEKKLFINGLSDISHSSHILRALGKNIFSNVKNKYYSDKESL